MPEQKALFCEKQLLSYLNQIIDTEMRFQFNYISYFNDETIYLIYKQQRCYLRGAPSILSYFETSQCESYQEYRLNKAIHLNYYDVTPLISAQSTLLKKLIQESIQYAQEEKQEKKARYSNNLRSLVNLNRSVVRLLSEIAVHDVITFKSLGAVPCYLKLQQQSTERHQINESLFWRLVGAELGCFDIFISAEQRLLYRSLLAEHGGRVE